MDFLRKLGVYLNDEPGDKEAIAFAGLLARLAMPESISCIYVRGIEENPVPQPLPDVEMLRQRLAEGLPEDIVRHVDIQVSQTAGLYELLRTARESDFDMIVVGRHLPHDQMGSGSTFYRLARKTPCSLLAVPASSDVRLSRLLVLVDGSEHSRMALERAAGIAAAAGKDPQLLIQSVCSVAYGYHYAGMTFEQACRHYSQMTRKQTQALVDGADLRGVSYEIEITCSDDAAAATHDLASARNVDAIVIGSRGATLPANALLGVTTERVLRDAPCPVLVVKRKGETFRFLDAVLAQIQQPI